MTSNSRPNNSVCPSLRLLFADLLDDVHDAPAQRAALDRHESLDQREPFVRCDELVDEGRRRRSIEVRGATALGQLFKEELRRHLEDVGDLLEPARTDAVRALL